MSMLTKVVFSSVVIARQGNGYYVQAEEAVDGHLEWLSSYGSENLVAPMQYMKATWFVNRQWQHRWPSQITNVDILRKNSSFEFLRAAASHAW